MGIKRYVASKDNTITNALKSNLTTRATDANMGASDILETFSIYGQASTTSAETQRILIQFPVDTISTDRTSKKIPTNHKATATITVADGDAANGMTEKQHITITSTDGTTKRYVLTNAALDDTTVTGTILSDGETDTGAGTAGADEDLGVAVSIDLSSATQNAYLVALKAAIEHANGHNGKITVSAVPGQATGNQSITLTQATAGESGNTAITENLANVTKTDFTGGITNVNFYLRMFNAVHGQPLPRDLVLTARPITKTWDEGYGLDMDSYSDKGYPLVTGSTWHTASGYVKWDTPGGDVSLDAKNNYTDYFEKGDENLEINITNLMEDWLYGTRSNYGMLIQVTSSQEAFNGSEGTLAEVLSLNLTGSKKSYYTKKFHGRTSEYFFKRPIIEARWDYNRIKDDRGKAHYSSSLLRNTDNLNTLYLYNYVGGKLRNIPYLADNLIYVQLFSGSLGNTAPQGAALTMAAPDGGSAGGVSSGSPTVIAGGLVSGEVGIYTASFALTSNIAPTDVLTDIFDVWMNGAGVASSTVQFHTSSFKIDKFPAYDYNYEPEYVAKITNLKDSYDHGETAKLRIFNRLKNWQPNVYTVANSTPQNTIIQSGSYRVYRVRDNMEVIRHSTASSDNETYLSYDKNGNFFDLDTSMLEPGYMYGIELAYYVGDTWNIQKNKFKFRVDEREQV